MATITSILRCHGCQKNFPDIIAAEQHSVDMDGLHVDFDSISSTFANPGGPSPARVIQDASVTRGEAISQLPSEQQLRQSPAHHVAAAEQKEVYNAEKKEEMMSRLKQARLQEEKAQREERDRVRRLIEQDKARRKLDREAPPPLQRLPPASLAPASAPPSDGTAEGGGKPEARIRLRMFDTGDIIDGKFPTDTKLSDIANMLQQESAGLLEVESFTLQAGFPRKVWKQEDFVSVTLEQAGLAKGAALIVKRKKRQ